MSACFHVACGALLIGESNFLLIFAATQEILLKSSRAFASSFTVLFCQCGGLLSGSLLNSGLDSVEQGERSCLKCEGGKRSLVNRRPS